MCYTLSVMRRENEKNTGLKKEDKMKVGMRYKVKMGSKSSVLEFMGKGKIGDLTTLKFKEIVGRVLKVYVVIEGEYEMRELSLNELRYGVKVGGEIDKDEKKSLNKKKEQK